MFCDVLSENIAAFVNALVLLADGKRINSPVFEFQSRYINVIPNPKGISLPFEDKSVCVCVPAFLLPKSRLQLNDRLNGI